MCLYPKRIKNKKYLPNEKNGGLVPAIPTLPGIKKNIDIYDITTGEVTGTKEIIYKKADTRVLYVEVPCGQCEECRKKKAREWQVRLYEEIQTHSYNYFVTFTFSPKSLREIMTQIGTKDECNAAAQYALRHCLERWRKDHKKSLKHWFVTELGHNGTERIHMHGLILSDEPLKFTPTPDKNWYKWKYWKYGFIFVGQYVNARTINYIVKYLNKVDTDHKGFYGKILCSPGIGKNFIEKINVTNTYKYKPHDTKGFYRLENGSKIALPKYYNNKLHGEEERELIWRDRMDIGQTVISGNKYLQEQTEPLEIHKIRTKAQEVNISLGYGSDSKEWRKKSWNITREMLESEKKAKNSFENLHISK